jgi:hypothetical protein
MSAYFITAWVVRTGPRGSGDGNSSLIVCADNLEAAERLFRESLIPPSDAQPPESVEIRKIFATPVMEQLFTEPGTQPLDWPTIVKESVADAESVPVDDFEQGYWLDVNEAVRSGGGIDALRESLPEDVRSGLNWSADKQFLFLLTVFSPPPPDLDDFEEADSEAGPSGKETSSEPSLSELREQQAVYPLLADKEVAVIIRARNSAVAASLWRNHAAGSKLADNSIRIDSLCAVTWPEG